MAAQLLTSAAASLDGSCSTSIDAAGATDGNTADGLPEDAFSCRIVSVGVSDAFVKNETVNLTANVTATACEEDGIAENRIASQVRTPSRGPRTAPGLGFLVAQLFAQLFPLPPVHASVLRMTCACCCTR